MPRDIVLLDGGMGQELLRRSHNKAPRCWSAQYLLDEPDLVRGLHGEFIAAGAKVITINAYSASYNRMAMVGADDRVPVLQRTACELALQARDVAGAQAHDVKIAGCLPPLNGSYRADRVRPYDDNVTEYRRLVEHQAPYVDLFICETMSSAIEALAAATAASESGKPFFVGCTLVDEGGTTLRSGETIAAFAGAIADLEPDALLANCTSPESVLAAMPELTVAASGRAFGGYANGFTGIPENYVPGKTFEKLEARRDLGPDAYSDFAMSWAASGATVLGGCCEVGPAHIAYLGRGLTDAGYKIVSGMQTRLTSLGN